MKGRCFPARLAIVSVCAFLCGLCWGCTGGVRTETPAERLEKQVLTSFDSFQEEVYAMGSVRGVDAATGKPTPPPPITDSKRRALDAQRSREFNRDDIRLFKDKAYIGENNKGLVEFVSGQKEKLKQDDPRLCDLVEAIVEEENRDRTTIMERVVETTDTLDPDRGLEQVMKIVARKNRDEARPGDWIQLDDNTWQRKNAQEPKE